MSSPIINYFNRAENHLRCESLIGVLKERGGRELEGRFEREYSLEIGEVRRNGGRREERRENKGVICG